MGALLGQLAAAGVQIEPAGEGKIRANGPLTDDLRAMIREHKPAILAELAANDADIATPEQRQELRDLLAVVLANDSDTEREETLATACADPDAALTCFRLLAADKRDTWRCHAC